VAPVADCVGTDAAGRGQGRKREEGKEGKEALDTYTRFLARMPSALVVVEVV
jgi:hypothetical protein